MTAFQPRPVYSFIWKTPPSSLEFHCPTMAQLKAEIIKLFVFFPRFSILSKIFKRLAFANHSLSTSLDFLFEQVRPSSAKRFTSNWTWTKEDYEEFWGRTVAELLFMKERVKKKLHRKMASIDRSSSPGYEHFARKVVRALSFQTYGSKLSRRYLLVAFIDPSLNVSVEACTSCFEAKSFWKSYVTTLLSRAC